MERTSKEVSDGLRLAASQDDATFQELLDIVFAVLSRDGSPAEDLLESSPVLSQAFGVIQSKQCYAALVTVVLEGAKTDSTAATLSPLLEENGFDDAKIGAFSSLYDSRSARIRDILSLTGMGAPNIVNLTWRLDYHVRSSSAGRANEPVYFIKLTTKSVAGELKDIEFTCNVAQLQDLLAKVRDATKQIERMMSASDVGGVSG